MQQRNSSVVQTFMPSKRRMLPLLVESILLCTAMVFILVAWSIRQAPSDPIRGALVILGGILVVFLMSIAFAAMAYRVARPSPAITILREGLLENASLLYRGIGLLHWSDIASITAKDYVTEPFFGVLHRRFLVIILENWKEYERRLPLWVSIQRMVFRWILWPPPGISIPQFMLPTTADEVAAQILAVYQRMEAHAPSDE